MTDSLAAKPFAIPPLAVYVHWPYCARICPYCDFNVVRARGGAEPALLARAIVRDLAGQAADLGPRRLSSIFFGGGTPSLMTPEQVGIHSAPIESLRGGDAATNAAILRAIFAGERGPHRDVVLLNAAAVLITAGTIPASPPFRHEAFRAGIDLAAKTIDSGAVAALVADLAQAES